MTDLQDLIQAVLNNPKEDTPVAMLSDYLLEKGDGRGEVLRRWLVEETRSTCWQDRTCVSEAAHHVESFSSCCWHSYLCIGTARVGNLPVFEMMVANGRSLYYYTLPVSIEDAYRIAESYPNPAEIKAFLDRHFTDPKRLGALRKSFV